MAIRTGDRVRVMVGADRGKVGKVLRVAPRLGELRVEGVRLTKIHRRARRGHPGGITETEGRVAASSVMLICPHCAHPTRQQRQPSGGRGCHRCGKGF